MRYVSSTLALIASFLVFTGPVRAEPPSQDDGIEVLARGPVHEAYAEPVSATPGATPIIAQQPPALLEEMPADQKPEGDVQWIPGYWAWDEDRTDFLWVSGFWRLPPPGREWIPGHWVAVEGGWQWTPGFWAESDQEELAYYPAPPEPVDASPSVPAATATSVFVPGTWVYQETRYVWRPGFWSDYRPGWIWIPAHYVWTPAGYLYVEGYWDYPLRERGLLFAPVAIDWGLALRPHWSYRPRYVVNDDCLLGALFVSPGCDHYYFGDYFDAGYRGRGFSSWLDFRFGYGGCDPLYSYYRSCYGADSHWEHGLRDLYEGRFSGDLARPPRTLIQQNTVVQNFTNNTTINNIKNVTNVQNVTMLTPLSQVSPTVARLRPVTEQGAALRVAQERLSLDAQRAKFESNIAAQSHSGRPGATGFVSTTATPQVRKISLPKASPVALAPGLAGSAAVNAPAPLTVNHSGENPRRVSSAVGAKPQAALGAKPQATQINQQHGGQPSAIPTAPVAAKTASSTTPLTSTASLTGKAHSAAPSSSTPSAAKMPTVAAKPVSQHTVTQPSMTKSAPKPQAVPAAKGTSQRRVAHAPAPAAKPQAAALKAASKPQVTTAKLVVQQPVARPAAPTAAAPKPAPKPAPAVRSSSPSAAARPAISRPAAKPQAAAPARVAAKPQAAPARPPARPQAAPTPKPAARPQPAPAKPAAQPAAKQSAPKGNSKDQHR